MEYGIRIEFVDKKHLQAALRMLKSPAADEKDVGKMVIAAAAIYGEGDDLAICDRCAGRAPSDLPACPFCGEVGQGIDAGQLTSPPVAQDAGEDESTARQPTVASSNGFRRTKIKDGEGKSAVETEEVKEKNGSIVVHREATKQLATVADLDRELIRYRQMKEDVSTSLWRLGAQIALLKDGDLWKQRKKNGEGKYKNWEVFCKEELGMTYSNAFMLMDVSKKYAEADVAALGGTSNCALLITAPDVDRPRLEEEVRREVSEGRAPKAREVKDRVLGARAKAGVLGIKRDTGRRRIGAASVKPKVSDKITVAFMTKLVTLKCVTKETAKDDDPKPARRLGDEPVVSYQLSNRVTLHFRIVLDDENQVTIKMQAKRDEMVG